MKKIPLLLVCLLLCVSAAQASLLLYSGNLSNAGEGSGSPGTGFALVGIDDVANSMRVQVTFSGLLGTTTASHIHCCTPTPGTGTVGVATQVPTFAGFPLGVTSGTYDQTFDLTLTSSWNPSFTSSHGGTPQGAEAALIAALGVDEAYLNIHTNLFPGGEIRAFLTAVPEPGSITLFATGWAGAAVLRRRLRK